VAEGEPVRSRLWLWLWLLPSIVCGSGGVGTLAAVLAGRSNSAPWIVSLSLLATLLTGLSTYYTMDQRHMRRSRSLAESARETAASASAAAVPAADNAPPAQKEPAVLNPKLLVTFTTADRAWARWITRQLIECGYLVSNRVWPARPLKPPEAADDAEPTAISEEAWPAYQVKRHARGFDCVLVLVSRASASARTNQHWWPTAIAAALASPTLKPQNPFLAVLVEKCDPNAAEGLGVAVDLAEQDADGCKVELTNHLGQVALHPPHAHAATIDLPLPSRGCLTNLRAPDASFVGRRQELGLLHVMLHPELIVSTGDRLGRAELSPTGSAGDLHAVVIHGLGGIGKTELANQYSWAHYDEYDLIWWVQADSPVSTVNGLIELAKLLNLPERQNHDETIISLWGVLRQRDRWLLILDNVDEPSSIHRAYWPAAKNGHVLVTSRVATEWEALTAHHVRLGALTPEESEEFLIRRIPKARPETTRRVAAAVDYLPLTLAQAATYVLEAGLTLEDYHELLRDTFDEAIAISQRNTQEAAGGYALVPMVSAASREPAARELLALLSMFGSTGIPRKMITQHADVLPARLCATMTDQLSQSRTIRELSRFSLIEAISDRFNVHSVVQSTMRSTLTADEQRLWSNTAIRLLHRAFPREPEEPGSWGACAFLMPHVEAARRMTGRFGAVDEQTAELLVLAGIYLHGRCDWQQAQAYLNDALTIREGLPEANPLTVAECLYHLGQSQFPLAQLDEARGNIKRALDIRRQELDASHPLIAQALIRLAEITREFATENDDALLYTELAQQLLDEVGANEAGIADALLIRGTILRNAGRISEALRAQRESLELNERVRAAGPSSVEVGINHSNIGVIYRDLGEWERAKSELETALGIMEPVLGDDHLEVAQVKKYLGDIHRRTGELDVASQLIDEVTDVHQRRPGEEHKLAACLAKLGSVQLAKGQAAQARTTLVKARDIYERAYGEDHPYVAKVLSRLGPVELALGQTTLADRTLVRAQNIFEVCYGREYPALAWVLESRAEICELRSEDQEAQMLRERARAIQRKARQ
jgi:tetratricopeptide (TPR) repeat protein